MVLYLARLKHPCIVNLLEFGIDRNVSVPFLIMEYASNGTLRQRYPSGSILPIATIFSYVKPIANALQFAHNQGIVHRDVKPGNMLISSSGDVLLSDFGIAITAHTTRSLSTQETMGTILYMAPEQIQGKARPASDQYSLATIVYEWLCGECPFSGLTSIEIAMGHLTKPVPSLREKIPSISSKLEKIVFKALNKDPKQRFATVTDFLQALEQISREQNQLHRPLVSRRLAIASLASLAIGASIEGIITLKSPLFNHQTSKMPVQNAPFLTPRTLTTALLTYKGHSDIVISVAWSPDGNQIASGSYDGTVQVWEPQTGKRVFTYKGHSDIVTSVAWSPDGKRIASGSYDHTVQIWDANDGQNSLTYHGHNGVVVSIAWSPDGTQIVSSGDDESTQVWNASLSGSLLFYHNHALSLTETVAWSPDGKRIASGSFDHTVQVWNPQTEVTYFTYLNHRDAVSSVAWSPDSLHIASGSFDHTVQLWNAFSQETPFIYRGHKDQVLTVSWSKDGRYVASGSRDTTVQILSTNTKKLVLTYQKHSAPVTSVDWAPNKALIASGSFDNTIQIWQIT